MKQRSLTLKKTLTKQSFRDYVFRFFRINKNFLDTNYICILIKLDIFTKNNSLVSRETFNLGTQRLLDVTNKDEKLSYVNYLTDELFLILENNKTKAKDKIIINYFNIEEETYINNLENSIKNSL